LVAYLVRKMTAFPTMTLGLAVSSSSWIIVALYPTTVGFVLALVVLATGEMIQTTRYYEYISNLAPSGQQGLYMGFAFLPIAIGNILAGLLGGYLLHYFGDVLHKPNQMWWVVAGVGFAGVILMIVYDRVFKPGQASAANKPA
jgi:POT family proton-dependent oligopeptide transporter